LKYCKAHANSFSGLLPGLLSIVIIMPEKELYNINICCISPVQTIEDTEGAKENKNSPVKIAFGSIEVEYQIYSNAYIEENHE